MAALAAASDSLCGVADVQVGSPAEIEASRLGRAYFVRLMSASQASAFIIYASAFVHLVAFDGALRRPAAMLAA